ncbi:IS431mec, transposase family protein [Enterococcus faecalis LA3B-2]|nr:IS431mec, transposase family protein [Enterococcus faecalis LA3B-2]
MIIVTVDYYLRYNLSYREVQELLYDRGIHVCHTTIYRWIQEYGKILYHLWKKKRRQSFYSRKMGENLYQIQREMALFVSRDRCRRFNSGHLAK